MLTVFWWGNLRERDDLEEQGVDGLTVLKWVKVNFTLEQALKAQSGSRGIAVLFL
jgi:hypothetical protein